MYSSDFTRDPHSTRPRNADYFEHPKKLGARNLAPGIPNV
jgi:hypothetical protein